MQSRELNASGDSIARNRMTCLCYHFMESVKQNRALDEIAEAMELAKRVKERPIAEIYKLSVIS